MANTPPPVVRPRLTFVSFTFNEEKAIIKYHCCSNAVELVYYRRLQDGQGHLVTVSQAFSESVQNRRQESQASRVGAGFSIVSTCECNAGIRVTLQDDGSMSLTVSDHDTGI